MPAVRGRLIREAYEGMGLKRKEFAAKASIHPETLTNISCGAPCSYPAAVRIARALELDVNQILDEPHDQVEQAS